MKKIYLFLLLAVIGIMQVFADQAVVDGITYDLDAENKTAKFAIVDANKNLNIETLTIPATITVSDVVYKVVGFSGEGAFRGGKFKNIVFEEPTNLTDFASWAFIECNNVKEIVVPEGITTFSYNSSMGRMASLEKVVCPSTLTTICDYTWRSNPSLKVVQFKGVNPPSTVGSSAFRETTPLQNVTIVVPDGAVDNYCNVDRFGRNLFVNDNQNDGTKNALRNIISESEYNSGKYLARGERLLSSQANYIKDGSLVYIQAAAYTACSPRFIKQVGDEMTWQGGASYSAVWRLVASGKNATINEKTVPTYYFQNVSTGKYAKCINANQRMDMTLEKGEAAEMAIFSISNPPYANGSYHSAAPNYIDANDENSVAIFDITDGNKRLLNNSRFCDLHFNTKNPDVLTWQWNLYEATNEYIEYLQKIEKENATWITINNDLPVAYKNLKTLAEDLNSTKEECEEAKTELENILAITKEEYPAVELAKGERLNSTQIDDGDLIIIEAASTTNVYDYYLSEQSGTRGLSNRNSLYFSKGLTDNDIWKVIKVEENKCKLQNVKTGLFIKKKVSGSDYGYLTASENESYIFLIQNPTEGGATTYNSTSTNPTGWDDNSVVFKCSDNTNYWLGNDVDKKDTDGMIYFNGTHRMCWNVYRASNEYIEYLKAFEKENAGWLSDVALKKKFDELMAEAEAENPLQCQFDAAKVTLKSLLIGSKYEKGERLLSTTPYSFKEGDRIIIEAVSTTKNYGYYIKDDNGYKWAQGLDAKSIWELVASGTANRFYLQNIGTGKYVGPWNNNMVENIADAREVQFFNISTNSNIGKSDYNDQKIYPRGWDEESWAILMIKANNSNQWWRNDGGSNETGAVHTGGTGKHNTQWNIYRAKRKVPTETIKADVLDVEFGNENEATDISKSQYNVTAYGDAHGEYNPHLGKYVGVTENTPGTQGSNYYRINYTGTDAIRTALPNGFSFETVLAVTKAPSTTVETKFFSSTSSGGTALMCKGGKFAMATNITPTGGSKDWKWAQSTLAPILNEYYHIVGIWDKEKGETKIYINGTLAGSGEAEGTFNWPSSSGHYWFSIGGSSNSSANVTANAGSWKIATQRIYSQALDDEQVTDLYVSISGDMEKANAFNALDELVTNEPDYNSDPKIIQSSLVEYNKALNAAKDVITEVKALTSGKTTRTAQEYLELKDALIQAKDLIISCPLADVLDVKYNTDGTAIDNSAMGNIVEKIGDGNVVEYSKPFGKNIAKFSTAYGDRPTDYYKVDYSTATDGKMLAALQSGHTLETVFCFREGERTNVETKWFSSHQSGGTGLMICTTGNGKNKTNEITFLPSVGGYKWAVSGVEPEVGKYYHVVGIWDDILGKARIYVNGELMNEVDAVGTLTVPGNASRWFCIGGDPNSDHAEQGGNWNVTVSRIYDTPLTTGQVSYLWEQEKNGVFLATAYECLENLVKTYTTGDNDYEAAAVSNQKIAAFVDVLKEAQELMNNAELSTASVYQDMADRLSTAYDNIAVGDNFKYFNNLAVKEGSFVQVKATGLAEGDKIKLVSKTNSYTLDLTMTDNGAKYFIPADFVTDTYDMCIIRDNISFASFGKIQLEVVDVLPTGSRVVAHRGFFNSTPTTNQNSRQAIRNAMAAAFAGCEIDVWMTTDGHVMVSHDASIGGKTVQTSTYEQMLTVKLSNGEVLPELKDFFDIMKKEYPNSPTKLQIEIKYNTSSTNTLDMCATIVNQVREYGLENRICYISYSMPACKEILRLNPKAEVAFLGGSSYLTPDDLAKEGDMSMDYEHTIIKAHPEYLDDAVRLGMDVFVYTVDLESQILLYNKMGVDYVVTNHPDVAQEIYEYYKENNKLSTIGSEGKVIIDFTKKITPEIYVSAMKDIEEDLLIVDLSNCILARDLTYEVLTSVTSNPNTLFYLPENTRLSGEHNIIVNGVCENLVLTDRMSFGPGVEFTATSATLTKPSIDGGLYTMYLPYAYSKPNNTVVYTFEGATNNVLKFEEFTDETIPAYTPVLFQRTDDNTETLSFGGANVTISNETTGSVDFKGTLKFMDANEVANGNIKYILNADGTKFSKAIAGATIPAFRCYLEATSSTSNEFTIVLEDVTGAKTILKGAEAQKVFNTLGVVGETNGVNVTTIGKKYVK